jgi:hypothetical protein
LIIFFFFFFFFFFFSCFTFLFLTVVCLLFRMVRLSETAKTTLYNWVVNTLSSFYKADKNSLATYVTALVDAADAVRHNEFKADLSDFLGSHTDDFVRELSDTVRKLSEMESDGPSSSSAPAAVAVSSASSSSGSRPSSNRRDDRSSERDRGRRGRSRSRSRSPPSKRRTYQPQQPPPVYAPPPFRPKPDAPVRPKADHSKTTSINVTDIPRHQCDMRLISGFFARFGPVVACRVDPELQRATVTYAEPSQAKAAISSSLPVLNNRFIKIYWDTSNAVSLADAPAPAAASAPASFPAVAAVAASAPPVPNPAAAAEAAEKAAERYRKWQEAQKNDEHLREVQQQREALRKKQLSEIASMTVMLSSATGKKREFLMKQIEDLTALVQASLKPDQVEIL